VTRSVVETLYGIIGDEIAESSYNPEELAMIYDPIFYYGRYLNPKTREYALHNLFSNLSKGIAYLGLGAGNTPSIIDLGCGLGMQSFIFAYLGAKVLGLDLDSRCIALCRKRKSYFEAKLGTALTADFAAVDFRHLDPRSVNGKYDGLFSMSAFAHIHPLANTVATISSLLYENGRVFIWDQNPGYLFLNSISKTRRSLPSPIHISSEFSKHGFKTEILQGAGSLPHQFWLPGAAGALSSAVDSAFKKSLRLSFNYLFGASRHGQPGRTSDRRS